MLIYLFRTSCLLHEEVDLIVRLRNMNEADVEDQLQLIGDQWI